MPLSTSPKKALTVNRGKVLQLNFWDIGNLKWKENVSNDNLDIGVVLVKVTLTLKLVR